jgi:hypothetical protein
VLALSLRTDKVYNNNYEVADRYCNLLSKGILSGCLGERIRFKKNIREELELDALAWEKAQNFREYISTFREKKQEFTEEDHNFVEWATKHAGQTHTKFLILRG